MSFIPVFKCPVSPEEDRSIVLEEEEEESVVVVILVVLLVVLEVVLWVVLVLVSTALCCDLLEEDEAEEEERRLFFPCGCFGCNVDEEPEGDKVEEEGEGVVEGRGAEVGVEAVEAADGCGG